ncbi:hypothetical protein JCM1841_004809 [Sporobolomyces salmonicolor]
MKAVPVEIHLCEVDELESDDLRSHGPSETLSLFKDLSEPQKADVPDCLPDLGRSPKRCAINLKKPEAKPAPNPERYVYFMPDLGEDGNPHRTLSPPLHPHPLTFEQQQVKGLLEGLADDVLDDDFALSGDEKIEEGAGEEKDLEAVEQLLEPAVNDHFDTLASQPAVNEADAFPGIGGIKPRSQADSTRSLSLTSMSNGQHAQSQRPIWRLFRRRSLRFSSLRSPRVLRGPSAPRDSPPAALVPPRAAHRRRPHNTPPLAYFDVTLVGVEVAELEPSAETTLLKWEVTKLTKGVTARDKKLGEMSEEVRREAKGKEEMKPQDRRRQENEENWNEEKETWRMRVDVLKEVRRELLDQLKETEGIATRGDEQDVGAA